MKIVVAFAFCLVLFSAFGGDNGIQALLRIRHEATSLAVEIADLKKENARLRVSAEALRNDPKTIEAVARETLGLARADEIVVTRLRSTPFAPGYGAAGR